MAKKKINQKTIPLHSMSPQQLEQLATNCISEGKLRLARDAYKELVRIDRARFLPELLRCYNLLALQMAEKGQTIEANNLIAYIKELGGETAVTVTINQGKSENYKSSIVEYMNLLQSGKDVPQEIKFKAADEAIANRKLPDDVHHPFFLDYNAITAAVTAICNKEFDTAQQILKPLAFDSPFSQWKLFARGMCCYYCADDERAEKFFTKLTPSTVPAILAKSYLTLLNQKKYLSNDDSDRENVLKNACVLGGYENLTECIPRAEYLWMTKRYRDSFSHIERNLDSFPALGTGIAANLTNFYFNIFHHLDENQQNRYLDVLRKLFKRFEGKKYTLTQFLSHKTMCIHSTHNYYEESEDVIELWEYLYEMYQELFGSDKDLQTEIYLMLGVVFSGQNQNLSIHDPFLKSNDSDLQAAEICFLKAIELSKSREAYLSLLRLYTNSDRKNDCRELISDAVNSFPNDKELLQTAGIMAINRNAVYKGVEYLERAFVLDPIDPVLRAQLSISYFTAAKQAAKTKSGIKKMHLYLDKAENLCPDGGNGFNDDVRYVLIRKAALEFLTGNESNGYKELQHAISLPGNRIAIIYFGLQIFRSYKVPLPFLNDLRTEIDRVFISNPEIKTLNILLDVFNFTVKLKDNPSVSFERDRLSRYLISALKVNTFSQDDIKRYIDFAVNQNLQKVTETITSLACKADPSCPLYRFYKYKYSADKLRYLSPQKIQSGIKNLNGILADAQKINDIHTVQLINSELKYLESQQRNPFHDFPLPMDKLDLEELEQLGETLSLFEMDDEDDDEFDLRPPRKSKKKKNSRSDFF